MSEKCCDISCPFATTCVHFDEKKKAKQPTHGRRVGLICRDYVNSEDVEK